MSGITAVPLRPVSRKVLATLWIGIALLVGLAIWAARAGAQDAALTAKPAAEFMASHGRAKNVITTASGLQYQVLTPASGPKPGATDYVLIDYDGKLTDGTMFDTSAKQGRPVPMQVNQVVPGFSEALQLMEKGSKYRFWIPPALGYGDQGGGPIPPDSVLVFDVTLHEIATAEQLRGAAAAQAGAGAVQP